MTAIPQVTFSLQPVVPNFPEELHECIDMTPELQAWAGSMIEQFHLRFDDLKGRERMALSASRGEASWKANGGPRASINADHAQHLLGLLDLMAKGKVSSSWDGWIDRREWNSIIDALTEVA